MPRGIPGVWLTLLHYILFSVDCQLLDNVCHKDDLDCLHPNIDVTGKLVHGKCLKGNTLRRHLDVSLLECVRECMVTSQCTGINYRKNWKICDVTNDLSGAFEDELECVYSDIDSWSKGLGGQCHNNKCPAGTSCIVDQNGNLGCKDTYCKGLPVTPNATCIEKFGLYRNIGWGNKFSCNGNFKLKGNPFAVCQNTDTWITRFCCMLKPIDECSGITEETTDGVNIICPADLYLNVEAFCDLHTDGHKWTIIQRRINGSLDFYKNWSAYENVLDQPSVNITLVTMKPSAINKQLIPHSNTVIHAITSQERHVLRVIMTDFDGDERYAEYSSFSIGDSSTQYQLSCSGYSGTAGDSFCSYHSGYKFYTYDKDNSDSCANKYHGAWWYNACHRSNLNGKYYQVGPSPHGIGMNWFKFHKHEYSMMSTIMMIRRAY